MQCWHSQSNYKKPYLCSRLYKKENNELFGLGTPLQAGNVFRTKFTCSLKLVHFARLCAFHSRNINHHFPPLAFSGRVQSPRSTPPPGLSPSHRGRLPVLHLSSFHSSEGAKSGPQSLSLSLVGSSLSARSFRVAVFDEILRQLTDTNFVGQRDALCQKNVFTKK